MKSGGGGVVEHFFNAVQLTIIAQWIFLSLYSLWRWFDFQHNRTRMTWPRQKWHSEVSVGPSLTSNKWQQICYKPETLQNRWPAEFTNLKSVVGGCCCTYVAQSASYSCSCTEPFILYELHSGKSYHPLDYGLVTLAKPYTYKVNLYKLSTFYKMNRLNQNNACLVTLIGHIWVDSSKNLRICKGK